MSPVPPAACLGVGPRRHAVEGRRRGLAEMASGDRHSHDGTARASRHGGRCRTSPASPVPLIVRSRPLLQGEAPKGCCCCCCSSESTPARLCSHTTRARALCEPRGSPSQGHEAATGAGRTHLEGRRKERRDRRVGTPLFGDRPATAVLFCKTPSHSSSLAALARAEEGSARAAEQSNASACGCSPRRVRQWKGAPCLSLEGLADDDASGA